MSCAPLRRLGTALLLMSVAASAAAQQMPVTDASTTSAAPSAEDAVVDGQAPFGWLAMPKITMPKLTMPKIEMPKMPTDPLAPFKSGARKVKEGTSKAWQGTKEMFSFGGNRNGNAAAPSSTPQPSFWQRLFVSSDPPQNDGPETITEFMNQPRLNP